MGRYSIILHVYTVKGPNETVWSFETATIANKFLKTLTGCYDLLPDNAYKVKIFYDDTLVFENV